MKLDAFDDLYKKLNLAQKDAVDTIEGPVMVIAGPGTGKTTILTLRIANILKRTDTPSSGILAITYTDAGVKAMRAKLHAIIGERAHDVHIHTFHAFSSSIIAEYPDHFLHISGMKQMSDIDQESLIRLILSDPKFGELRPAGKPDVYISSILRSIDDAKREALTPEMVREHCKSKIEHITNDEASISTRGASKGELKAEAKDALEKCERTELFSNVYELYESKKREAGRMDFNDLIIELLLAIRRDELLLRLIQERYLYVHVDEHQDTNDAQNFIVGLIVEFFDTPNIFIVGDEKQAIYRFQGASVENFLLLQKKWPDMKIISLHTNYRSHQSILDASFSMIEKNYAPGEHSDLRIQLRSEGKDTQRPVDIVTGENVAGSELYLIEALQKLIAKEPQATVAIILRRNRDLEKIIRLLESHNIPVSSERSVDIFSHPVGRIFFDLIEYLVDPTRLDALAKTIIAGMWQLSFEKSTELVLALQSGQSSLQLTNELRGLFSIQKMMLNDSAVGFLIHAAEQSGFISLIARHPSYIHVWRGIITLAESLTREGNIRDPRELMKNMLTYRTSAESRTVKVAVGAPDLVIQALTAHGSKGLEFDYVFIPYATEEAWVGRLKGASFDLPKKRTSEGDIRDVRRLFYVALTRARKHVTILTALLESDGKMLTPLRFIDELDPKHVIRATVPRVGAEMLYSTQMTVQSGGQESEKADRALIDLAKHVLLKKGLSVTALNHFVKCPNTFLYLSILKLPQALSASGEKGTAMHEALHKVWSAKSRSIREIELSLTQTITDYFATSFLPLLLKESAKKELLEHVGAVAKALVSHFSIPQNSTVFTEVWIKTDYVTSFENQPISIPTHGKLDTLVDTGNEAMIFDYKTKQAMSVAAIKGETKNTDGSYFRQLIFYKILASKDARFRNRKITPALVFVSPDPKGRCPIITLPIEQSDIDRVKKEIQTLVGAIWSGKIAHMKCDEMKCEWCALREITR